MKAGAAALRLQAECYHEKVAETKTLRTTIEYAESPMPHSLTLFETHGILAAKYQL